MRGVVPIRHRRKRVLQGPGFCALKTPDCPTRLETATPACPKTRTTARGITTLRRYYALRSEAEVTVDESKRLWMDTPFSVFALQCEFSFLRLNKATC